MINNKTGEERGREKEERDKTKIITKGTDKKGRGKKKERRHSGKDDRAEHCSLLQQREESSPTSTAITTPLLSLGAIGCVTRVTKEIVKTLAKK